MFRTNTDIKQYIKNSWGLLLLVFCLCYLLYHIISGERGVIKMMYLHKQIESSRSVLDKKQADKAKLEDNIKRLSSTGLDLDLLDERARVVLNFAQYDEFVILDH